MIVVWRSPEDCVVAILWPGEDVFIIFDVDIQVEIGVIATVDVPIRVVVKVAYHCNDLRGVRSADTS